MPLKSQRDLIYRFGHHLACVSKWPEVRGAAKVRLQGFCLQVQRSSHRMGAALGVHSCNIPATERVFRGSSAVGDRGCIGQQAPLGLASVSHPPSVVLRFILRGATGHRGWVWDGQSSACAPAPPPLQSSSTFVLHKVAFEERVPQPVKDICVHKESSCT